MLHSLTFMQLPSISIENLLRIINQFPILMISLKLIILDHGNREKRVEESGLVKCLDGRYL